MDHHLGSHFPPLNCGPHALHRRNRDDLGVDLAVACEDAEDDRLAPAPRPRLPRTRRAPKYDSSNLDLDLAGTDRASRLALVGQAGAEPEVCGGAAPPHLVDRADGDACEAGGVRGGGQVRGGEARALPENPLKTRTPGSERLKWRSGTVGPG